MSRSAAHFIGAQRRGRIGGEERITGSGGENHHAAALHMALGATADIGLANLHHADADSTRVSTPMRSSVFWMARALSTVAGMPYSRAGTFHAVLLPRCRGKYCRRTPGIFTPMANAF